MTIIDQAKMSLGECSLSHESILYQLIGYHEHAYNFGNVNERIAADLFFMSLLEITRDKLSITIKP